MCKDLSRVGLTTSASRVRAVPVALREEGHSAAVHAWVEARLQLLTAVELRSRAG
ncbi:hypothetical protein [Streptomyces sp. NPDC013457]|uniref:hypothetical protein n=1 Tax=Streptomyces sp. NPDC013457 TaxID=3364866 RepID=UPI0036FC5CFC